jgi:hypothetical protein
MRKQVARQLSKKKKNEDGENKATHRVHFLPCARKPLHCCALQCADHLHHSVEIVNGAQRAAQSNKLV